MSLSVPKISARRQCISSKWLFWGHESIQYCKTNVGNDIRNKFAEFGFRVVPRWATKRPFNLQNIPRS